MTSRLLSLSLLGLLAACSGGGDSSPASQPAQPANQLSALATVGKRLFMDPALSASGQQSCATCHVPDNGYSPDDGRPTQLGGPAMNLEGLRASPSLGYAHYTPAFSVGSDGKVTGGFMRDGRQPTLAAQATGPFVSSFEMANQDAAEVLGRLKSRPYLAEFVAIFGQASLNDADQTLNNMGRAIAAFETEDQSFHRFDSKYDAWTQGKATLTARESNGFRLFNDPSKGNCVACHTTASKNGVPALFTDFTYDNLGVPRNWKLKANSDTNAPAYAPANGAQFAGEHRYYDMGVCGPMRTDRPGLTSACGKFKVPTLRNVALRNAFFHNGVFDNLEDVVTWYVSRDANAARWYVQADGKTPDRSYNDIPQMFQANVNVTEPPYNPALQVSLTQQEIRDVVAFLCTLTDGYDPAKPDTYRKPAQCQLDKP
ncbi:diacylglycerol kinase [Burkholderiaceae bacterium DAT-1]|nr:diacylglycerol kinase [Burkholderiaceae bacterium DAT-1]